MNSVALLRLARPGYGDGFETGAATCRRQLQNALTKRADSQSCKHNLPEDGESSLWRDDLRVVRGSFATVSPEITIPPCTHAPFAFRPEP